MTDAAEDVVDPALTPGSYELQKDGKYIRTDEPTAAAEAAGSGVELKAARALAAANERIGFPVPPEIAAAIEADDAERARAKAERAAARPVSAAHTTAAGTAGAPAPKDA